MKFRHLLLLLGLAVLVVLAGCGEQASPGTNPSSTATPTASTTPAARTTPAASATSAHETPTAPAATPTPRTSAVEYTVVPGDSLWSIAARFGVAVDVLAAANNISNPNLLFAGQVLTVPPPGATLPTATATPAPPSATPVPPTPTLPPAGTILQYTVQPGDWVAAVARRFDTTVDAIVAHNNLDDPNKILSGTVLTIVVGDHTTQPTPVPTQTPAPAPPTPAPSGQSGTKWIDVDIATQTLRAYEGDTVVYQTLVSTGVAVYPTVKGTFHIFQKLLADDMRGGSGADAYYLPNVPYVMYFAEGGYALHGTYWHHNFGHPMSHGCVNLATPDAQWLYNWAPLGTTVVVH